MKSLLFILTCLFIGFGSSLAQELIDPLKPLEPFVGKTWKGEFSDGGVDISKWERTLNGKAVRITHSINDGEYGGETIIYFDQAKDSLIFYYFTTAGFYTNGTVWFEDGKFISHEYVTGSAEGVTEVKAIGEVLEDGRLKSTSKYLKNGEWTEGHSATYVEAPDAEVKFK